MRRWQAMIQLDLPTLEAILHPDLIYTHSNGQVDTKASLLEKLQSEKIRYLTVSPFQREVRAFTDFGIITGTTQMQVQAGEQIITLRVVFTDVYIKADDRWQTIAWQSTPLSDTN